MDPTQFMLPMPSMIAPHLMSSIPTSTGPVGGMPLDVLGMWANGKYIKKIELICFSRMSATDYYGEICC